MKVFVMVENWDARTVVVTGRYLGGCWAETLAECLGTLTDVQSAA